jgi:hypothetical protein
MGNIHVLQPAANLQQAGAHTYQSYPVSRAVQEIDWISRNIDLDIPTVSELQDTLPIALNFFNLGNG